MTGVTNFTLWLVRHAETDLAGTFCGHSDPPVNSRGHRQIVSLVRDLQGHAIDAVYSSDLKRALTTAEAIADSSGASLVVAADLREINFGEWEALTWGQIERRDPAYAQRWISEYPNLSAPNGELFEGFANRVLHFFDSCVAANRHAAVVTHVGVLRVILTRRCGCTDEQAWWQTRPYCSHVPFQKFATEHSRRYAPKTIDLTTDENHKQATANLVSNSGELL
jgi:broad specificity phosphatase PhoE